MNLVTVIDRQTTLTRPEVPGDVISLDEKSFSHTLPRAKLERKYNSMPPGAVANLFTGLQTSKTARGLFNPNYSEVAI